MSKRTASLPLAPPLAPPLTPSLAAATFRKLELTVARRVDAILYGDHSGLSLGLGSDREELVLYQPGHDVRRIDWNATARTGQPRVWLTRAEHGLETWALIDQSPSMAFGTTDFEKLDVAIWAAAAFGLVAKGAGDRFGLGLCSPSGLRWFAPRSGRATARALVGAEPAPREGVGPVSLSESILRMAARSPKPGLRIVISDFVETADVVERAEVFEWQAPLRRLTARHDVIVVEVIDPRELELPNVGEVRFVDPETGAQRFVSTSNKRVRESYAAAASTHRLATEAAIRGTGAAHLRLSTDDDLARTLSRFLRRRRLAPKRVRSARPGASRSPVSAPARDAATGTATRTGTGTATCTATGAATATATGAPTATAIGAPRSPR